MKESWITFLKEVNDQITKFESYGCDTICFRGHADKNWNLEPTLFVKQKLHKYTDKQINNLENILFFDFVTNAGTLINSNITDWEILFLMRHHGIPTRILDWTENFGTALYFALNGDEKTPTIWIMDPYELNKISYGEESIPNPIKDLNFNYESAYLSKKSNPYTNPIAIIPPRTSERLFAQKGLFTLQGSSNEPLNNIPELSSCFKKIEIPLDAIDDAKHFLKLFGINHYSIFPDLDGLSKHLIDITFSNKL